MNERIKELASQFFDVRNGTIVSPVDGYQDIEEELQSFAEFIIKECIAIIQETNLIDDDPVVIIKEHFGIE
jgi:hypothetical protein